ncbi:MAG TPA: hypothetical protein VFR84_04615 [Candidatus Angelobacter sp.]|nr:hypothetical protein [Candidatus Angelobacter sp.]
MSAGTSVTAGAAAAPGASAAPQPTMKQEWFKAFITSGVALVLTPLTVSLTFFFTTALQSPKPSIEESSPGILYDQIPMSADLARVFKTNPTTAAHLRDAIGVTQTTDQDTDCVEWMQTLQWRKDCSQRVHSALAEIRGQAQAARDNPFTRSPDITQGITSDLKAIELIEKMINAVDEKPYTSRTGYVQVQVGVYNSGASDGVVKNLSRFEFDGQKVTLGSGSWTPLKSHAFSEVTFSTWNISVSGEEAAEQELQRRIKNHQEVRGKLEVDVSDKTVVTDVTFSAKD